jgi:serine/threonine protein kinase
MRFECLWQTTGIAVVGQHSLGEENAATQDVTVGIVGTVAYMAPGQLHGETADVRSHTYSAGAVLYEMATGSWLVVPNRYDQEHGIRENSSCLRDKTIWNRSEARAFSIEVLREFSTRVFLHFGVGEQDAAQAADVLVCADLRGIDSHGVARLHTYFELVNEDRINPRPQVKVIRSTPSTATIDGNNGLGLVIGPQGNRIATDLAAKSGTGWVSVRNTNHFGIAGYYALEALEHDVIGLAMTNSTKLVAP